jgi:S-DNA-T family DNA segregation ATPase FtsK/SpoIIIE
MAARSKAKPRGRARPRAKRSSTKLPVLEQRHLDLIGLALVALSVFLAFVLYGGWQGGRAGEAMVEGLGWLVGRIRYLAPVAIMAAGALMVLRPVLPAVRPFRSGGACLFAALTLAIAAGTLGLGPGGSGVHWDRFWVTPRGGLVGEGLYWATSTLLGTVGAHILAVFLFLAAVLLLTGATVAGVVKATSTHVAETTKALRPRPRPVAKPAKLRPPEPVHSEPVVTRPVEDLQERFADVFEEVEEEPEPEPEPVAEEPLEPVEEELEEEPAPADVTQAIDPSQLTPQGRYRSEVTDDPDFIWKRPQPTKVLVRSTAEQARPDTAGQEKTARSLIEALSHFGIEAKVVATVAGPHITRYEIRLAPGIKMSKVAQLKDDLAYALAATEIRILAPIPGKTAVGIEVPNERRKIVQLGDVYGQTPADWSPLTVWLGKDVAGRAIGADLAKMPHILVAGTTGAGKSGAVNAMLSSILLHATPQEVRLVLVDPKQVELNHYDGIPHLLTPVITSPRMAANALQNLVKEMEDRYSTMSLARTRNLVELNRRRAERGEPALPYVLCVIDELADLMMVAPADVEDSIIRLAQKARAVGIHLVLATQSPRVDVITGMIKANVPSRIAFAVSSQTDSRVILDQNGAESLLGKGDMLFSPVGSSKLQRIQGAYIDEPQIETLTEFWRKQGEPELREDLLEEVEDETPADAGGAPDDFSPDEDPLLEDAIRLVAEMQTASTSMLQRRLRLGYTRAGRLIDMLERRGVISGYEGSKPRQVLVGEGDAERFLANLRERDASRGAVPEPVAVPDDAD